MCLNRARWSVPGLPGAEVVPGEDEVMAVERGIELWVVRALVGAAALGARERAEREQPGQRMGVVEQALEAVGGADDAGVPPQRLARRGVGEWRRGERAQRRDLRGRGWRGGGGGRGERVQDGAAGEDEALAERVRG